MGFCVFFFPLLLKIHMDKLTEIKSDYLLHSTEDCSSLPHWEVLGPVVKIIYIVIEKFFF